MVLKLATEYPDRIAGVLSFSPAAGEPMGECQPTEYARGLKVPALAIRPQREMDFPGVRQSLEALANLGVRTIVTEHGAHGSSILVSARSGHDMSGLQRVVLDFLAEVAPDR